MKMLDQLSSPQRAFANGFVADSTRRTRLIAGPGTGKTTVATFIAAQCINKGTFRSVLFLSHNRTLAIHWYRLSEAVDLPARLSIDDFVQTPGTTFAATTALLSQQFRFDQLLRYVSSNATLIIHDEAHETSEELLPLIDQLVDANSRSRYLALFTPYQDIAPAKYEREFDSEYFLDRPSIVLPPTGTELARFSPSYPLLQQLLARTRSVEDLSWREFERLIAELLSREGYSVELMQGTKDGGVDVVAVMNHGPSGLFKTLWQAKKMHRNKVGLEVVRELADTRNEFGASKAIVVTSSYLTRGALQRIERDRFTLGKVDRADLDAWIARTLLGKHGG